MMIMSQGRLSNKFLIIHVTKQISSKEEMEYYGDDEDEDNDDLVSRKEKK